MIDVKLSDGREITVDLYKITLSEYDSLFDNEKAEEEKHEIMARCFKMTVEEWRALPLPDGAQLQIVFWKKCREIFETPKNSPSAST